MRIRLITVCVLVACSTLMADEANKKVKEIQKKLVERAGKHHSVQYDMKMTADMHQQGMKMESDTKAKYLRKDDKLLMRMDMDSTVTMGAGPNAQKMKQTSLMIMDGEFMWSLADMMGQKMATKMKIPENGQDPFKPDEGWEKFDIKALDDAKVGDMDCWVLEMTPKDPASKAKMSKSVNYYDQKTGLLVKQIGYNEKGEAIRSITVSNIEVDKKIDPKVFEFKAPEGVKVQDMTKGGMGMPGMGH